MSGKKGWVTGKVQGVGFRYFVQRCAEREGLTGYARNLKDGRVEVLLQGPATHLQKVVPEVETGPPASLVVEVIWEDDHSSPLSDFTTA